MSKVKKECNIWYTLDGEIVTVGDLRELVEELNAIKVPDNYLLTTCNVEFYFAGNPELILDGDSMPNEDRYNLLVEMKYDKEKESQ